MKIAHTINEVKSCVREWKKAGLSIGLVPTMGYLHEGHASLIERARKENDKVIVSDFVNPIQFGPKEDLATYPRDFDADCKLCESLGADLIFNPEPDEMYSGDFHSYVGVNTRADRYISMVSALLSASFSIFLRLTELILVKKMPSSLLS